MGRRLPLTDAKCWSIALVILVIACWLNGCGSVGRARDALRNAGASAASDRWGFIDRPDQEQLLECVTGVESVRVVVDRVESRMSVGELSGSGWVAEWTSQWSFVSPSALGVDGDEWVRIDRDDSVAVREVEDALGSSIAAYVFADRLPPSPRALIASALEEPADIEFVEQGVGATRDVRVVIEDERMAEVEGASKGGFPSLTFTIDGDEVVAVAARDSGSDGEESFGFRWEFDSLPRSSPSTPTEWRDLDTLDPRPVGRPPPPCEIGP